MPTTYYLNIPGADPGIQMNEGDYLQITFVTPAKFCISEGQADYFNPQLPVGVAENQGTVWTGQASVPLGTIKYSHVAHNGNCGSPNPRNVPPGTIQIGTTPK